MIHDPSQDRQTIEKNSDITVVQWRRKWQPIPLFLLKEPMDSMKRQKDMTPEDKLPGQEVSNMLLGKTRGQLLIAPVRMK